MRKPVNTFQNLEKSHLGIADILKNQSNFSAPFLKIWITSEKKNRKKYSRFWANTNIFFITFSVNFLCSMNDQQAELLDSCHIY